MIVLSCLISIVNFNPALAQDTPKTKAVLLSGRVVDAKNRKAIGNVSVSLTGTNIGTVSNADGYFSLRCEPDSLSRVMFSSVGYSSAFVYAYDLIGHNRVIRMKRQEVELSEVVVYGGDATAIVAEAIKKIPKNYSASNDMLSVFYRETIRKGKRFIGVSEAAIDVFKTPYTVRNADRDRVQIKRGRRLVSQKNSDTIAVKIVGGPNLAAYVDFVKNADILFSEHDLEDFKFSMEQPEYIDDRIQYVVEFTPKVKRDYVMFRGKLYIDKELLAFTRAEFEMDPTDRVKMTAAVLQKKPRGLRFSPHKISFIVSYKPSNGRACLNYVQNEMRFKCDMKRKLFSSSYVAHTEMVVVDHEENTTSRISSRDSFKPQQIFYDLVDEYWDEDYWSDYNIIEPTESLEHAVERLKKKVSMR